jgi:hypothetical protein
MSNAAIWAGSAGNKFRIAARDSTDPSVKLLAEGLTDLAEAIKELDQAVATVRRVWCGDVRPALVWRAEQFPRFVLDGNDLGPVTTIQGG